MVRQGDNRSTHKKSKFEASLDTAMDVCPVEVIGKILSQMTCARDIAVASTTCRKWQEAARSHIDKLRFDDTDWPKIIKRWEHDEETMWSVRELIIMETVMRTTCLKELSICCTEGLQGGNSKMHAGGVVSCLLHVKRTLKSFTLMSPLIPNVNILGYLAGSASVLEGLEWGHAYIPTLIPCIHGLPSLISLTLKKVVEGMSAKNLLLLLSVFPKLENLSLSEICIMNVPSTMELKISSLKTLSMDLILTEDPTTLVLCDDKLGKVSVKEMRFGHLCWMRREGDKGMQLLRLQGLHVADFEVGEGLGHLEMEDVNIPLLEVKESLQHLIIRDSKIRLLKLENLVSLLELELINNEDFEAAWWRTYSQIVSKAGSKLYKFTARGGLPEKRLIDLDEIARMFPQLNEISVDYQNAFFDGSAQQPRLLMEMANLELHAVMLPEDCIPLSKWIDGLINRCPSLKSIVIVLDMALTTAPVEHYEFIGELSSLLIQIMRPRPHIHVSFQFL